MRAKCHRNQHSIIFVAFDSEETGCLGSLEFIRSFLIPDFIDKFGNQIQGAIVIDTVLNWDDRPGSQEVPDAWHKIVPNVAKEIEANEYKGDFLAIVSRKHVAGEAKMAKLFRKYYASLKGRVANKQGLLHHMELSNMPTNRVPTSQEMLNHTSFWRSDHCRFWYHNGKSKFRSLNSILLTDTGKNCNALVIAISNFNVHIVRRNRLLIAACTIKPFS